MALNDIKFIKGQGGLGATLPNTDHKSGMIFLLKYLYDGTVPTVPFAYNTVASLADAVSKGITESVYPEAHYQISEFFRMQSDSTLHVMFGTAEDADFDFSEIETIQNNADGELRQVAVISDSAFNPADITIMQAVADTVYDNHKPLSIIYGASLAGEALSALANVRALQCPNVSVVIGMDGANAGKALYDAGKIVPCVGAVLGAVSRSAVNESIAWVQQFRMSQVELDVPAFANGELVKNVETYTLNQLNDYGYVFLRKHVGITGSYINENSTSDLATSDYAYINNVRTIDKAIRNTRTALLPKLNSPVTLTGAGKLALETIVDWENTAKNALEAMVRDGEISGYAVQINPDQDIAATSKLIINITLVIRGIARNVEVEIGYGTV